jgi:uncharacterized protein (DUF302 family)
MSADGLKTVVSSGGPKETMDRLEAEIKSKGLTVWRVSTMHRERRASVWPTEVLIFGNAMGGTALMQADQRNRHRFTTQGAGLPG